MSCAQYVLLTGRKIVKCLHGTGRQIMKIMRNDLIIRPCRPRQSPLNPHSSSKKITSSIVARNFVFIPKKTVSQEPCCAIATSSSPGSRRVTVM
jgi:hypothetical protein